MQWVMVVCGLVLVNLAGCGSDSASVGSRPTATTTAAATTANPGTGTSSNSTPGGSSQPDTPDSTVLTVRNSKALAALMKVGDSCGEPIARFADENRGRTIEFNGSIVNVMQHGDYDTRYDILVAPGSKGPNSTVGPAFKFENVNVFDLNLTGDNPPASIQEGDRFRFAAEVVDYNQDQCLFRLDPVSTTAR